MDLEYKIFKFKSGETIISEVNATTDDVLSLHRPMMFKVVTMLDDNMNQSDILVFRNWAEFSTEQDITISPDMIGASYKPDVIITNCYEMEKIKQDFPDMYKLLKKEDPMQSPPPASLDNPFKKSQLPSNMANFNLTIPIDVAKNLIEFLEQEGIDLIGPDLDGPPDEDDEEFDLEDDLSNHPADEQKGFGNHLDDWSPDPNDYLR